HMRMISIERNEARAARPRARGREKGGERSRLPRAHAVRESARAALALVSLALLVPSYAAAADNEEVAELRRMLQEVQAQNRELARRRGAGGGARAPPQTKPARPQERPTPALTAANPSTVFDSPPAAPPLPEPHGTTGMGLEERVKELEIGWAAQEN